MSPRAAWRLESLGFDPVYDYVGSKMEWIGAGLAWEGSEALQATLGALASPDVAVCALDGSVGDVRATLEQNSVCVVVNDERIVLGVVAAEGLEADDDQPVVAVMQEGPSTYRPHVTATEMADRLAENCQPEVLVTTLDGRLVGMASAEDITKAAPREEP